MDQLTLSLREKTLEQKVEILEIIEWAFSKYGRISNSNHNGDQ